jgi:hypothetical protein
MVNQWVGFGGVSQERLAEGFWEKADRVDVVW